MAKNVTGPYTNSITTTALVVSGQTFTGNVVNSSTISPGDPTGILVESDSTITGNISNAGTISVVGAGINVTASTIDGSIIESGTLLASGVGISIDSATKIASPSTAIQISGSTFSGGITNAGNISASGSSGIWLHNLSLFSGGISNAGTISGQGSGNGIFLGNGVVSTFIGDIVNTGTISQTGQFSADVDLDDNPVFDGSVINRGTMVAGFNAISISNSTLGFQTFDGGITNTGTIDSLSANGIDIDTSSYVIEGSIVNATGATIAAGIAPHNAPLVDTGIELQGPGFNTLAGSIFNAGLITAPADGIDAQYAVLGGITNAGTISVAGYTGIEGGTVTNTGEITVTGVNTLAGPHEGISGDSVYNGSNAVIDAPAGGSGFSGTGIGIYADGGSGGVVNAGVISGTVGIEVPSSFVTYSGTASAINNSGSITAATGIYLLAGTLDGNIVANGTIDASAHGILIGSGGKISTTDTAIVVGGATFIGGITNNGTIAGAVGIVVNANVASFGSDAIVNSGTIVGSDGTAIDLAATEAIAMVVSGGSIVGDVLGNAVNDRLDFALGSGATFTYGGLISGFAAVDLNSGTLTLASGGVIDGALTFSGIATLQLEAATSQIAGDLFGVTSGDAIDLAFQSFSAGDTASWTQSGTSGTLALLTSGGTTLDSLILIGTYSPDNFSATSDGGSGTVIDVSIPVLPPVVSAGGTAIFDGGGAAVALDSSLTVTESGGSAAIGATVTIAAGFLSGDTLTISGGTSGSIVDGGGTITYSFGGSTLTLAGSDAVADYQAALDAVNYSFSPSDGDPTAGGDTSRTIDWVVSGTSASNVASSFLDTVHVAPALSVSGSPTYSQGSGAVTLDASLTVSDQDSNNELTSATVVVGGGFTGDGDVLSANTSSTAITATYNSDTETLTLSGSGTVADYQSVLRTVTFTNSGGNPTDFGSDSSRSVTWTVNDGATSNSSATGSQTLSISPNPIYVPAGQTSSGLTIGSGIVLDVLSGGTASNTTISSGGSEVISAGGTDLGALIATGGIQLDYGLASGANVNSGGTTLVLSGGTASGATVASAGVEYIGSGGTTVSAQIAGGGAEVVFGSALGTVLSGTSAATATQYDFGIALGGTTYANGFQQVALSGAIASGMSVQYGGEQYVGAGGTTLSAEVASGGAEVVFGYDSGASLSGTQYDYGIASGGTTYSNGYQEVAAGATAIGMTVLSGGYQYIGTGGIASATTIEEQGAEVVFGSALGGLVSATQYDFDYASGGTTFSSGYQLVASGATAIGMTVEAGGQQYIGSDGTALATDIGAGGVEQIFGSDSGALVSGTQYVYGVVTGGTTFNGGYQLVGPAGTGTATGMTVLGGGQQYVVAGATASASEIASRGVEIVHGTDLDATVSGTQYVYGLASGTVVAAGGYQQVLAGGTTSAATISGGIIELMSGASDAAAPLTLAGAGELILDASTLFSGTVAGFDSASTNDSIDFADIPYVAAGSGGATAVHWTPASGSGTLSVSEDGHIANVTLLGQYTGTFNASAAGDGTLVTYSPATTATDLNALVLTTPRHG